MKIALAFYGQLRNIDICFPYWKTNIIDTLNIKDIYTHTYHEPIEDIKWNSIHSTSFKVGPSVLQEFKDLYKPKIIIESYYDDIKTSAQYFEPAPERLAACVYQSFTPQAIYFSMYNVMNLINDNDYDAVILSRTDNIFVKQINELPIKENEVLASSFASSFGNEGEWISDMVSAGSVVTMKKYAAVYTNYKKMYEDGRLFHVETTIAENIKREKLTYNIFFKYPEQHYMIRDQKSLLNL